METVQETNEQKPCPPCKCNRTKALAVVFVGLVAVLLLRNWGPKSASASEGWSDDWNAAVHESEATGKPTLVLFTADWCDACKRFDANTLANEEVREYLQNNYTPVVFDVSDRSGPNLEKAKSLGVDSIPIVVIYDKSGREQARAVGMPAKQFLAWLKSGGTELTAICPPPEPEATASNQTND